MNKILSLEQALEFSQKLRSKNKSIVVAGGCFDILHPGHIKFLELAKMEGDCLMVLLESDENVRKLKGRLRPVNKQKERALLLSTLPSIDCVVLLPRLAQNLDYDGIIRALKPDVLATTEGEKVNYHLKRQANEVGAKVVSVTGRIKDYSSTKFANLIKAYGL